MTITATTIVSDGFNCAEVRMQPQLFINHSSTGLLDWRHSQEWEEAEFL